MYGETYTDCEFPQEELTILQIVYNTTNGPYWHWRNATDNVTNSENIAILNAFKDSSYSSQIQNIPSWVDNYDIDFTPSNPSSNNLAIWNFTGIHNPCIESWQGLTCSYEVRPGKLPLCHLSGIYLSKFNLTGTLPNAITALSYVTVINMRNNHLYGTLPSGLTNMTSLDYISLQDNYLTGSIDSKIFQMRFLTTIDFSLNELSGHISLHGLSKSIKRILLGFNNFTNSLDEIFYDWNSTNSECMLEAFDLTRKNIYGTLSTHLCSCHHMMYLGFGDNHLHGTVPECYASFDKLMSFSVLANKLYGSLPYGFFNISNLYTVDLSENKFEMDISEIFTANLSSLALLSLYEVYPCL